MEPQNKKIKHYRFLAAAVVLVIFLIIFNHGWRKEDVGHLVMYTCDQGKTISAEYYKGEDKPSPSPGLPPVPVGEVVLQLSDGRAMTLHQTISADGVRYANQDESFVFLGKGDGALVLENNTQKSYIGCIAALSESNK